MSQSADKAHTNFTITTTFHKGWEIREVPIDVREDGNLDCDRPLGSLSSLIPKDQASKDF